MVQLHRYVPQQTPLPIFPYATDKYLSAKQLAIEADNPLQQRKAYLLARKATNKVFRELAKTDLKGEEAKNILRPFSELKLDEFVVILSAILEIQNPGWDHLTTLLFPFDTSVGRSPRTADNISINLDDSNTRLHPFLEEIAQRHYGAYVVERNGIKQYALNSELGGRRRPY